MNLSETHYLLTLIARFDNRRFDDATVLAWREVLADLTQADCRAAVLGHVGTSDAYLMPVHIRRGVEQLHRDRARAERERDAEMRRNDLPALDLGPIRPRKAEVDALIADLRDRMPSGDPAKLRGPAWRQRTRAGLHAARPLAIEPSTPVTSEPDEKPEHPTPKEPQPDAAPAA